MTTSEADRLVERYLDDLRREARHLPSARRAELLDEIAIHITEARAELPYEDASAIRTLLDELGDPAEIAREAADPPQRRRGRAPCTGGLSATGRALWIAAARRPPRGGVPYDRLPRPQAPAGSRVASAPALIARAACRVRARVRAGRPARRRRRPRSRARMD